MKLEDFLALPGTPCIRVRVGPGLYDEVEVSQAYFDEHKEELRAFCEGLGDVTAYNWRSMRQFTEDNGLMAKLLIALGDLADAWKMHPPLESGVGMWNKDHPRVFQLVGFAPPTRVPKPSAGGLDTGAECACCDRPMGPVDSDVHDLVESHGQPAMCVECFAEGCDLERETCLVFPEKRAEERRRRPAPEDSEESGPPSGLEAYLSQFDE